MQFGLKFAFQPIKIQKSPPPHPTGGGRSVTWTSVRCTFGPKLVFLPHATPKSKNERHAVWERFGKKRNERQAAWERFWHVHGPVWWPKMGFRKSPKPFILNGLGRFFAKIEKHHLKTWNGRPRDIEKQNARATTRKTVAPKYWKT